MIKIKEQLHDLVFDDLAFAARMALRTNWTEEDFIKFSKMAWDLTAHKVKTVSK